MMIIHDVYNTSQILKINYNSTIISNVIIKIFVSGCTASNQNGVRLLYTPMTASSFGHLCLTSMRHGKQHGMRAIKGSA